jgi:hypothetical protein
LNISKVGWSYSRSRSDVKSQLYARMLASVELMLLMRCKTTSRLLCADNLARKLCLEIGSDSRSRDLQIVASAG